MGRDGDGDGDGVHVQLSSIEYRGRRSRGTYIYKEEDRALGAPIYIRKKKITRKGS